jgi:hypothetical protein
MSSYNYSILGDFQGGLVNTEQLTNEVKASEISSTCIGITTVDDVMSISFSSSLSAPDIITLDSLVSNHVYVSPKSYTSLYQIFPRSITFNNMNVYKKICSVIYNGDDELPLTKISVVSQQENTSGSYCIRVYDSTSNKILAERTYNNTEFELHDIINLTNIPTINSIIEIQGKKLTTEGHYHVENVMFYN